MATAIVTVIIFLMLISIHEFGHFIAAKSVGIKVLEFAVGMGPAIWKKQKGETLYSVRVLPIGGYCKMEGEDEESDDERAYSSQSLWKRMIVVVAGAVLNLVLGFAIFIGIVANAPYLNTNTVESVVPNSYLEQAGVQKGDKIVKINGKTVSFYQDIALYTSTFKKDIPVELTVRRSNEVLHFSVRPTLQKTTYKYTDDGVEYIEEINGVVENGFQPYGEDGLQKDESKIGTQEESERLLIGFVPMKKSVTVWNVAPEAFRYTKFVVKLVYQAFFKMVTGSVSINQMSGPVGIVSEVNNAVKSGWMYVWNLVALLTINLGVFNLLPLPALDGGRLFFMLIEAVRRKPIPPEKEGMIHAIGLVCLLIFMAFISYHDIMRLFSK
ncbi:MAG: site-2 protease family protein [Clostridia bacterium]|nr:site-2 protease family protein [Clostridia bacterium]